MVEIIQAGCGNVGSEALRIAEENPDLDIKHKTILVGDLKKSRPKTDATFVDNPEKIPMQADVFVDLLPGTQMDLAYKLINYALRSGIPVVSANKGLIATHGPELHRTAKDHHTRLLYGAAVGGGIDILSRLRNSHQADSIDSISGIMNGTSNFMLTKMAKGMSYDEVLKEAQEKGYAEADPTFDVSGKDAAQKLAILASKLSGGFVDFEKIPTEGIEHLQQVDFEIADKFGYVIKPVASYKNTASGIEVSVGPVLLPKSHPLANVNDAVNAFNYHAQHAGDALLTGEGAGGAPTASTVLSDVLALANGQSEYLGHQDVTFANTSANTDDTSVQGYVRTLSKDAPGTMQEITGVFAKFGINIADIIQSRKYKTESGSTPDFFLLDPTPRRRLTGALEKLALTDAVQTIPYFLRIEGGSK